MTEEGAIKEIRENMLCDYCIAGCDECDIESCSNKDAFSVAIKALEEVQQYRKHGLTVENALDNMCDLAAAENLIEEYRAIGTPEECRKSVDICKAICGYMTAYDVTNSIIDEVNEQPTAYDPDRIVEQLNDKFRVVRTDEDLEWNRAMDEAITIVKGGEV